MIDSLLVGLNVEGEGANPKQPPPSGELLRSPFFLSTADARSPPTVKPSVA